MPTFTYNWNNAQTAFFVNDTVVNGDQGLPAIATTNSGFSYYTAYYDGSGAVWGQGFSNTAVQASDEELINGPIANVQTDPSIAQLIPQGFLAPPGAIAVTYTDYSVDAGGDVRVRLVSGGPGIFSGSAYGTLLGDFDVDISTSNDSDSDVAALSDGGFVVTFTRDFGGGDLDINGAIMNANGTVRTNIFVSTASDVSTSHSQVAGLTNGNFVVTWEQEPVAGGATQAWFKILNASGGTVVTSTLIDSFGSVNEDVQVVALSDGGFAVAYVDSGWSPFGGGSGNDITLAIYNANGTLRSSGLQLVNTEVTGTQDRPTITTLSNGYIVVGWNNAGALTYQAFALDGTRVGTNYVATTSVIDPEIAGLTGGLLANVRSTTTSEPTGTGDSIRSSIQELTRNAVGDATNETIVGDSLRDFFNGGAGNDILTGGTNVDTLTGGAGQDIFRDLASGLNGDTITDLSAGDRINVTNISSLTYSLSGHTLNFSNGSVTLTNLPFDHISARPGAGGGVDLLVVGTVSQTGDFNGDGRDDIMWRNTDTGVVTYWLGQTNGSFAGNAITSNAGTNYTAYGVGDFNGDGRDDVVWRENGSGIVSTWSGAANGGFVGNAATFTAGSDWTIISTGDYNGDTRDDILWRQAGSGIVTNWLGQANTTFTGNPAYYTAGLDWSVVGTGDFNHDGREDILWQQQGTGTVTNWLGQADGSFVGNSVYLDGSGPWTIYGVGDFNGDGFDDILWRNNDGTVTDWLGQSGGTFTSNAGVAFHTAGNEWSIIGIGDYNNDGRDDILWRSADGHVTDWLGQANGSFIGNAAANHEITAQWQAQPDIFA